MTCGPRALVLDGEAGIGKTTLWRHAVQEARDRGFQVLITRSARAETKHSYAGLTDVLAGIPQEVFTSLPGPQRHAIDAALLRSDPGPETPDPRTVATAFVTIVTRLAEVTPTLLAVDDVQWLDRPSARVLEFASRRLDGLPLGILVTARTPDQSGTPLGLDRAMTSEGLERVDVGPLSVAALHDVIDAQLGTDLTRTTLVKVRAMSGGNPFFAIEIARALGESGPLSSGQALPVPGTLLELVRDRLAGLPPSVGRVLLAISALARPTDELVERVVGRAPKTAIQTAIDRHIVERRDGSLAFTHPLLSAVVYDQARMDQRRRLHMKAAKLVDDSEECARHLSLGTTRPEPRIALALDRGAREAANRGAPESAAELSEGARRLTPADREEESWRRTMDAAGYHFAAGDGLRARDLLERVVGSAPAGPLRSEALLRLGMVRHHSEGPGAAIELFARALEEVADDTVLRSELEQQLSWTVGQAGDIPRGAEHASAALALAEQRGDGPAVSRALAMVAIFDFFLGRGVSASTMKRSLELEAWGEPLPVEWRPSFLHGYMLKITGELDEARVVLTELHQRLVERGDESALPWVLWHLSELEAFAGRWDDAASYADEGYEITLQTGQILMRSFLLSARAFVKAYTGRAEDARALAEEGLELALSAGLVPAIQFNTSALAFIDLSLGDAAGVHARLGPLAEMLATVGMGEPGILRFLPDEIEALVAVGELEKAKTLLDPFQEKARELDRTWAVAAAARCRALLDAAQGDLPGAIAAIDEALAAHGRLQEPMDLARTKLVAGQVYRRAKQKRAAKDALEEASSLFEELGAPLWAEKARAELGRVGLRPPAPTDLTETESRVAELAASGLTNREVADAAFLSSRSVEGVLARVYRKLGIGSRAELGAWMQERTGQHS
jgi:DNA-binding CsgD family transcriptional regulator